MATTSTQWHYVGTENPGVFSDSDNWQQGSAPQNTCQAQGTEPCEILVDASTPSELSEYLDGMTNLDVLNIDQTSRKP